MSSIPHSTRFPHSPATYCTGVAGLEGLQCRGILYGKGDLKSLRRSFDFCIHIALLVVLTQAFVWLLAALHYSKCP